jgi:hypothetical protein
MSEIYEFTIEGNLDPHWSQWFGQMSIDHLDKGETLIRGPVRDQAELYGILIKFRDLGLILTSVRRIDKEKK